MGGKCEGGSHSEGGLRKGEEAPDRSYDQSPVQEVWGVIRERRGSYREGAAGPPPHLDDATCVSHDERGGLLQAIDNLDSL